MLNTTSTYFIREISYVEIFFASAPLFVSGLHSALKCNQVDGMESSTGGLKMVQERDGCHSGVVKLGGLEVADISIFNNVYAG